MADLLREIEQCRKRWLKAKRKGDITMCSLWERVGKTLKQKARKRMGGKDLFGTAKSIFGANDDKKKKDN